MSGDQRLDVFAAGHFSMRRAAVALTCVAHRVTLGMALAPHSACPRRMTPTRHFDAAASSSVSAAAVDDLYHTTPSVRQSATAVSECGGWLRGRKTQGRISRVSKCLLLDLRCTLPAFRMAIAQISATCSRRETARQEAGDPIPASAVARYALADQGIGPHALLSNILGSPANSVL